MKKSLIVLSALVLTACSSGGVNEDKLKTVNRDLNIKHICIKGGTRAAPDDFVTSIKTSLQKKNITSESVTDRDDQNCEYILAFNVKGNRKIVAKSRVRVIQVVNKTEVGFLYYTRTGDEKDRVGKDGLQLQTDLMINQLFKDY